MSDLDPASMLSSSMSSLSTSSSRQSPSQISKTYKQASTLFLTRRLQEALSTLEPLVSTPATSDERPREGDAPKAAPIASASRTTRIKVWSLYLTLLDAIVKLGPEDGKAAFGSREWRELVAKVREGKIWGEVARQGYGGVEGSMDADVVINL